MILESTFPATAMQRDTSFPSLSLVVIIPNLLASMNALRSSTFSFTEVSSLFFAVYGSAGLLPVSVFEKDMIDLVVEKLFGLC